MFASSTLVLMMLRNHAAASGLDKFLRGTGG